MRKLIRPMGKLHYLLLVLAVFWAVQVVSQESTPNLTGIWRWNPDKSHVSGPPASNRRVKIEQNGSDITITIRVVYDVGEEFRKYHFTIGSDDNTNDLMGSPLKSKVQWKDGALAVDSTATTGYGRTAYERYVDLIPGRANSHLPSEPHHGRPAAHRRSDCL